MQAGQVLAQLDPTFAAADVGALAAQVASLQAQVSRLQAEADGQPFAYSGTDPNLALQAAISASGSPSTRYKLENYTQKINGIVSGDRQGEFRRGRATASRLEVATKRREDAAGPRSGCRSAASSTRWPRWTTGSRWSAICAARRKTASSGAARSRGAWSAERDGYVQSWHADVSEKLADATGKLSDARESLNKAQLRKQLVELRADKRRDRADGGQGSVGSVLQSGQQFITLVPADAPLEIEANIIGRDDGFVSVGDRSSVKFDTFPFIQYGLAYGTVRTISADSFTSQDEQRNPTGAVPVPSDSGESVLPGAHRRSTRWTCTARRRTSV